jgi:DNA-binding response OmpR family regulator
MFILIAETDLQLLADMKDALEQAGHEVTVASDGMEAWGYLVNPIPPDLLVTRIHLGSGTPPGTALGLHAHSCDPCIPVIYIPGSADGATFANPEHGAILVKPFAVAELVATAGRLLRASRAVSVRIGSRDPL